MDSRDDLIELIDNVSGGNVRVALDQVKAFMGSGHIDTEKIVRVYEEAGSYLVPLHEFLRAILFGDAKYYDRNKRYRMKGCYILILRMTNMAERKAGYFKIY